MMEKQGDLKTELEGYMKEKDLSNTFVSIVEAILIEKPDNPIGFTVKHLIEKYPSETKCAKEIFCLKSKSFKSPTTPNLVESENSESESDESDLEDQPQGHEDPPVLIYNRGKRRASICAEKLCPTTFDGGVVKKVPKSEEQGERILQIMQKNVLFRHLDDAQMESVRDAMFLVDRKKEDVVIRQGDDGDNFYIIDSGSIDVRIESISKSNSNGSEGSNNSDDSGEKKTNLKEESRLVATYTVGDSFGELAIMYNAPRAATCIAREGVRLWALDRKSFKIILMKTAIAKRNLYKAFLRQVPILSQLTEYEVLTIADALREEIFNDGDEICREGDAGDRFYIIKEGSVVCTKLAGDGKTQEVVARIDSGAYFGEIALMTSKPRQATVSASGTLDCLSLDRKTFKRVMGPLSDILMRNIKEYNKFQASNI